MPKIREVDMGLSYSPPEPKALAFHVCFPSPPHKLCAMLLKKGACSSNSMNYCPWLALHISLMPTQPGL